MLGLTCNGPGPVAGFFNLTEQDLLPSVAVPVAQVVIEHGASDGPVVVAEVRSGTGYNGNILTHAEAQASAIMRLQNIDNATPTSTATRVWEMEPNGCAQMLERMVPKGSTLTVYAPGSAQVIVGTGEPRP